VKIHKLPQKTRTKTDLLQSDTSKAAAAVINQINQDILPSAATLWQPEF
jgi:hypothetical protein